MDELSSGNRHRKGSSKAMAPASKPPKVGYNTDLGFWGQPRSFYMGIATGFVFLLAMLSLLQSFLSQF